MSSAGPFAAPMEVVFYRDLLCPWSYLAAKRLEPVIALFGAQVALTSRPFPARLEPGRPGPRERKLALRRLARVAKEPGGDALIPDLWAGDDPPLTGLTPLAAVEAARLQGARAAAALEAALRTAAFERGLNVSRPGVIIEVAEGLRGAGLDPVRLAADLAGGGQLGEVLAHRERAEALGIRAVPSLLVDRRWIVAGARSSDAYLTLLSRHLVQCRGGALQ
jgi:predicted DsbA family dithiol-disulfide isomerase